MTRPLIAMALALGALALQDAAAHAAAEASYVVLGEAGVAIARAVTRDAQCPDIVLDGDPTQMTLRVPADGDRFPVAVCELELPATVTRAEIDGAALPMPPSAGLSSIAIIGDTGCRMKKGMAFQACNDRAAWPFATIASDAAATLPQAVLHVGDYLYREAPCPIGDDGCAGSPWGDGWKSWNADFFRPAAPLLQAAPWIVVRGDHESCARAGEGYFRFLDPRPYGGSCSDMTAPYAVTLPGLRLIVMDSSGANIESQEKVRAAAYRRQLSGLGKQDGETWLATHMPFWALRAHAEPGKPATELTKALARAAEGLPLAGIGQIVTGHIHIFEAISFADKRPNQVVVGASGTSLDPPLKPDDGIAAAKPDGVTAVSAMGFATASRDRKGWVLRFQPLAPGVTTLCKGFGSRGDLACGG